MHHDEIIKSLEERLNSFCDIVETSGEYRFLDEKKIFKDYTDGYCYGEFDAVGIRGNTVFLFEVKGRDIYDNAKKAMYQLKRDEEYFKRICEDYKIHKFYAYSKDNKRGYNTEEIK